MNQGKQFVIWGSAGHARVIAEIIVQQGGSVAALFDNNPAASSISTAIPLYPGEAGFRDWLRGVDATQYYGVVAIGGGRGVDRVQLQQVFEQHGIRSQPLVHAAACVSPSARIGDGSQVLAHALVAAEASVGRACIINHKTSVDHECVIGNGVHLAPGTTLCGCVEIGEYSFVAAGSTVLPRVRIGANTVIGAGSLVTRDIPAGVVAYGRPAKVIRDIGKAAV